MNGKYFSLISGKQVRRAPGQKIVPAKEFSTLLDAKEVVSQVQEDAVTYKKQVTEECEKIKEQARREGFEKGYQEWVDQLTALEKEIKNVRSELEKVVLPVALKAAKKIVGRELDASDKVIVDIVSNALKSVSQNKKVTIWVNRKDLEPLEKNKDQLIKLFERLESLSIRERDDVSPGGCVIETETGIINAQLENQWMILENAFQKLLENEIEKERT